MDATYQLSIVEIRLLQLTLASIYMQEGVLEDKLYEIDVYKYAKEFNLTQTAAYHALIDVTKGLANKTITLKSTLVDSKASNTAKDIIPWVHRITNLKYNYIGI